MEDGLWLQIIRYFLWQDEVQEVGRPDSLNVKNKKRVRFKVKILYVSLCFNVICPLHEYLLLIIVSKLTV